MMKPQRFSPRWRKALTLSVLFALLLAVLLVDQAAVHAHTPALIGSGGGVDQEGTASQKGCSKESPYGFTTIHADENLIEHYQALGVCWVRYQIHENDLRQADGSYDWSKLDQTVALMNKAGIYMDVPLQCFEGPGTSCFGKNPYIPSIAEMTTFASQMAERYNGKNGKGIIHAFEIGNEEYDQVDLPITEYSDLLEAGYNAIKKVHPKALVGMYGPYKINLSYLEEVMTGLSDVRFDFANVHYYGQGEDPGLSSKDHPSYQEVIEAIGKWLPDKPVWVTEIGWATSCTNVKNCKPVSEQKQVQYLQQVMTDSQQAGVERIFWFTINYGDLGYSLAPTSGQKVAAYDALAQIVSSQPVWDTGSGQGGSGADPGAGNDVLEPVCQTTVTEQDGNTFHLSTTCTWTEQWLGEEETISCSLAQEKSDQSNKKSNTCKQEDLDLICKEAAKAGFDLDFCHTRTVTKTSTTILGEQENLPLSFVAFRPDAVRFQT